MKKLLLFLIGIIIITVPTWSKERGAIMFYEQNIAYVDGQAVYMPAPVTIINGQTMIPLDFMASLTGSKVSYENGYIWVNHNEREKPIVYFNRDFNGDTSQPNLRLDRLLGLIKNAKKSIWVQMFSFTYKPVIQALLKARERNVEIYCLFDNTKGNVEHSEDLIKAGVKIKYDWRGGVQFHRKLAVFDEMTVLIGSTNWSEQGFERNSEVDLSVDDPELASDILNQMFKDWKLAKDSLPDKP